MTAVVESLNAWGSAWAAFMLRALVDSSALLAVVALIWLPLRRRISAQFAHGMFLLVLLKLVAPIPTPWPIWSADAPIRRAASGLSAWAIANERASPIEVAPAPGPIVGASALTAPRLGLLSTPPATAPPRVTTPPSTPAILMIAWALVATVLLARFARSAWATRRLIRESLPVPDGSGWFEVDLEALRRTAGVRSEVRWAVNPRLTSPAVGGLIRPTVVMPPDLEEGLTPEQLRWVLLHELAHIRRGDLWVVVVQRWLGAIFFFDPAVHIAGWILGQLREYACDDAALAAADAPRRACGEGFLSVVARGVEHAPTPSPALGLFESRRLIHRRLLRILDGRRTVRDRLSRPAALSLVAIGLVVLPYGHPRDADASHPDPATIDGPDPSRTGAEEPQPFVLGSSPLRVDGPRASRTIIPRASLNSDLACVGPVVLSPDGKALAVAEAGYDSVGHVALWDLGRRTFVTLHGHRRGVASVAFSPDGTTLASSSWDLTIRLWDARTGAARGEFATTEAVARLAFSPDGKTLAAAGEDGALTLRDLDRGAREARIEGFRGTIFALGFSPDGLRIATGGGLDRGERGFGEVKVFDARSHREIADLAGHTASVRSIAFSPDGSSVITGGVDATVRIWDLETGKARLVRGGFPDPVRAIAVAPDGRSLAVAARGDGVVTLLDSSDGAEVARLVGSGGPVLGLAFLHGGRALAAGGFDPSIKLWDLPATRAGLVRR